MESALIYSVLIVAPLLVGFMFRARILFSPGLLMFLFFFFLVYGVAGVYTAYNYSSDVVKLGLILNRRDHYILYAFFCVLASFFVGLLGYFYGRKVVVFGFNEKQDLKVSDVNFFFFISIASLLIYARQYGGLTNALEMSAVIRSGHYDNQVGSFTFFKYFIPSVLFSLLGYFLFLCRDKSLKNLVLLGFCLVYCLIAFSFMGGRTRIAGIFLMIFFFYSVYTSEGVKVFRVFFVGLAAFLIIVPIVLYGKQFFSSMAKDKYSQAESFNRESVLESIGGYFSHRVYAVEASLDNFHARNEIHKFDDFFKSPLFFIPERLTGIEKPKSISYQSTADLTGISESTMPPGIVAYGIYGAWLPGLLLVSFAFGFFPGVFDRAVQSSNKALLPFLIPLIFYWFFYVSTGDPRIVVNAMVFFLLVPAWFVSLFVLRRFLAR